MSWQHPSTSYPPAALTALRKGYPDLVEARQSTWQHAFRGLYLALRRGHCDAFYLATPTVSPTNNSQQRRYVVAYTVGLTLASGCILLDTALDCHDSMCMHKQIVTHPRSCKRQRLDDC